MKIGIGIPLLGSVCGEAYPTHLEAVCDVARDHEVEIVTTVDVVSYDVARNIIYTNAVKAGCDVLFFVDSDTYLPKGAFGRLLGVFKAEDAVLVTGHYYRRGYPYTCVWSKITDGTYRGVECQGGTVEIDATGLGCALINLRWTEEHLASPVFQQGEGEHGWVPEDCYFCHTIKGAGGRILGVGDVRCGHVYTRVVISDKTAPWLRKHDMERDIEADTKRDKREGKGVLCLS